MNPEALTSRLQEALTQELRAVILYGSAAAGDHAGKRSDYNILVVVQDLGLATLQRVAPIARQWARAGNPPPLLFTEERLQASADVFPIELLDMRDCRRVLHGTDVLENIEIDRTNLRLELEHELRGKLIHVREQYLAVGGKPGPILDLMIDTLSTFQVLCRAALRLHAESVPRHKQDALHALAQHIPFDTEVFDILAELKAGTRKGRDVTPDALFERYVRAIEALVDAVDKDTPPR